MIPRVELGSSKGGLVFDGDVARELARKGSDEKAFIACIGCKHGARQQGIARVVGSDGVVLLSGGEQEALPFEGKVLLFVQEQARPQTTAGEQAEIDRVVAEQHRR